MPERTTVRLPADVQEKLNRLTDGYGTQTNVIEKAIERLYDYEHRRKHEELAVHSHTVCPWCSIDQGRMRHDGTTQLRNPHPTEEREL